MILYKDLSSALRNLQDMDEMGSANFQPREEGTGFVFEGIEDIIYMSKKVQLFICLGDQLEGLPLFKNVLYLYIVGKEPFITDDVYEMERHLKDLKEIAYNKTV